MNITGFRLCGRVLGPILIVLAAYLAAGVCSAQSPETRSRDPLTLLLFGATGEVGPPINFARRCGGANACAASAGANGLFPGVGINAVTGDLPFQPYPELNGGC